MRTVHREVDAGEIANIANTSATAWRRIARLTRLQFLALLALLFVFWTTCVVVVLTTFWMTAWSDRPAARGAVSVTSTATAVVGNLDERPRGVPTSAQVVERDLVLGDLKDGVHFFYDLKCSGGLLEIVTSKENVFAETWCDRGLPQQTLSRLAGQPIRIRVVEHRLVLEALFVGSFTFEIGRLWIETR